MVVPSDEAGTPPSSAIPDAGEAAGADAEKAAMVEQAKSRVAAVKESLDDKQPPLAAPPTAIPPPTPRRSESSS